ncbi:hypothetical protein [Petrachloros mirabilis]
MRDERLTRDTLSIEEAAISNMREMPAIIEVLELKKMLPVGKGAVTMCTLARLLLWIGVSVMLWGTVGCQYYEEYRVKKTTADLKEEQAALLHDYRVCLEKYQDDPPKAKELCGPYTQRLRQLDITHQSGK